MVVTIRPLLSVLSHGRARQRLPRLPPAAHAGHSPAPSSPTATHGGDSPAPSSPPTGGTRRRPLPLSLLSHRRHRFEPLHRRRRLGEDVVVAASRLQRVPLPSLGYPESTKRRRPSRAPQLWQASLFSRIPLFPFLSPALAFLCTDGQRNCCEVLVTKVGHANPGKERSPFPSLLHASDCLRGPILPHVMCGL